MEDLVIMDYNTSEIHLYRVNSDVNIDEDYIIKLGHNPNECSWMFSGFINIIKHKNEIN